MAKKLKDEEEKNHTSERSNRKTKVKDETMQSIIAILFFVLALIFILASFNKAGLIGQKTYDTFHYLFGLGYYLVPIVLVLMGIAFIRKLEQRVPLLKLFGGLLLFLSSLSAVELIHGGSGGKIGGLLGVPLVALFDIYGGAILLLGLVVISLFIIFDTHLKRDWSTLFGRKTEELRETEELSLTEKKHLDIASDKLEKSIPEKNTKQETTEEDGVEKPSLIKGVFGKKKVEEEEFISKEQIIFTRNKAYTPPPINLLELDKGKPGVGDIKSNANIIKRTLQNFGIDVEMDEVTIGPTVTRYSLKPAEGVKLSKIVSLQDNLALALAAQTIRIEAPIPGKSLVGIEVPNTSKTTVGLGSLISSKEYQTSPKPLLTTIGKDVSGAPKLADLAKMPHLLIAGTTGSGKSVTVHAILTSLLYRNSPDMLKFIMVDAKRVELTLYNKIPHLLTPVITEAKKTILALKWAAKEMDRRYDILEKVSVRDINSYHKNIVEPALKKAVEGVETPETMPYIVIVIDELADLMQAYPRELEAAIVRLAQMSRAVGIHLILSTQRPSVNVITGLIKANIPTRIALKVGSQIDSRTIIDKAGAEKLVGQGDMLFSTQDSPEPVRIQSPFISENEVKKVVKYIVEAYKDEVPELGLSLGGVQEGAEGKNPIFDSSGDNDDVDDDLYEEAKQTVIQAGKASTSYIQRKLRVGYARAARLMDILEEKGVIGPADGSRPREVIGADTKGTSVTEGEE